MNDFWQNEAGERWKKVCELTYVIGYLKGELRGKGYTGEQLDKLEQDAVAHYERLNG